MVWLVSPQNGRDLCTILVNLKLRQYGFSYLCKIILRSDKVRKLKTMALNYYDEEINLLLLMLL